MRELGSIGLVIMAAAMLAGCDSRIDDEPIPPPEVTVVERAVQPTSAPAQGDPTEGEEVIVEVEPEIDTAAPMDTTAPADAGLSMDELAEGDTIVEQAEQ